MQSCPHGRIQVFEEKRDLKSIYHQFKDFITPKESEDNIVNIATHRVEKFLEQFGLGTPLSS
jgi:hypothetical protein